MRNFRERLTIPVGQSVSNGVSLESEKLAGLRVVEDSDLNTLRFQALVDGNLGDAASESWADIQLTTGEFAPYTGVPFDVVTASLTDGALIIFPSDKVCGVPTVIRVLNHAAGTPTNITGTPAIVELLVEAGY